MGYFEYECPAGHITTALVKLADRPKQIPCEHAECKDTASLVMSAVQTNFHANDRKAIKRKGR